MREVFAVLGAENKYHHPLHLPRPTIIDRWEKREILPKKLKNLTTEADLGGQSSKHVLIASFLTLFQMKTALKQP